MLEESLAQSTVLLIDDMKTNFLLISAQLKKYQCKTIYEPDSLKGLSAAEAAKPDAILLDFDMPNLDGPAVCKQIRESSLVGDIPVVFLTANTDPECLSRAYDAGADDYLLKTATEKELVSRLSRVITTRYLKNQLRNRYEEQATFTRILSHDIINLITVAVSGILGVIRTAAKLPADQVKEFEKFTTRSKDALVRIQSLIANIRELQALDDDKIGAQLVSVNLSSLFKECQATFIEKLEQKKVTLTIDCDAQVCVLAEPVSLSLSVVNNIISNAIKFTNPNGTIAVVVNKLDQRVTVRIQDDGIGMDEELLKKIFRKDEKTTRLGTQNEKGTGFGMPIVKKYMELYGGKISVSSIPVEKNPNQHGTTIILEFKSAQEEISPHH